jgi:hypothetical protein
VEKEFSDDVLTLHEAVAPTLVSALAAAWPLATEALMQHRASGAAAVETFSGAATRLTEN